MSVVERLGLFLCLLHHNNAVLTKCHTTHSVARFDTEITTYPSFLRISGVTAEELTVDIVQQVLEHLDRCKCVNGGENV